MKCRKCGCFVFTIMDTGKTLRAFCVDCENEGIYSTYVWDTKERRIWDSEKKPTDKPTDGKEERG